MNLKDELRKIVQLQEIDSQIYKLRNEKDVEKPQNLEKFKNEVEQKKQDFLAFEEKNKEVLLRKKDKELNLASKEEALKKSQGQLYQLKTNKEYQAKLNEIGFLKADISKAEEEVLQVLEDIDSAKKELDLKREAFQEEEKELKNQENKLKNEINDMDIEIKSLEDKRKTFVGEIDKKILSKYDELILTRQGLAIVPVKGGHCGYCRLLTTHQKINQIKMYDSLTLCESCVHILYIPEDIE